MAAFAGACPASSCMRPSRPSWRFGLPDGRPRLRSSALPGRPNFYETRWTVEVLDYLRDDLRRDVVVAVLATWLTLAIVGRWNSERAWDDRLGRLLAVVWVCFYLGAQLMAPLP